MEAVSIFKNPESEARYMAAYESVLVRWPVPYETMEVSTRLGETHVISSGPRDACPLVLLPGNFDCSLSWFHSLKAFSATHRVHALDTIGDVGKSKACQLPADRDDFANWLADVFDALHIRAADLMGISYGGFLAVNFALKFQERARSLILLCPGLPLAPFTFQWMLRGMPMILRPSVGTVKWFIHGASNSRNYDDLMQVFIAGMTSVKSTRVLRPQIGEKEWKRLQMPILLLIGEQEIMYEPGRALRQAKQWMPHIQAGLIENAGHFLLADQPEQVTQRALEFLNTFE